MPITLVEASRKMPASDAHTWYHLDGAHAALVAYEGWFFTDKRLKNYKPGLTTYDNNTFMKVWINQ